MTDEKLVELCCRSRAAREWSEFDRRFRPVLASAIQGKLQVRGRAAPEDVEECVQQTFLRLCDRDYHGLRLVARVEPARIRAYLRTMACNIAIDHMRKIRQETGLDESLARDHPSSDNFVLINQIFELLENCVGKDPNRNRLIFKLYYRTGLTAANIAKLPGLRLSQKGVESRLHRLTECIREWVAEGKSGGHTSKWKGGPDGTD
jgi:RNA polymerase sigma-70 factor (ECF subfamily)